MNNAVLEAAVVDSSAIMSIFEGRASATAFRQALRRTTRLYMSAGTLMELSVIFIGKKSSAGTQPLVDLIQELQIQIVPLDLEMIKQGRQGCANIQDAMLLLGYSFDEKHSPYMPLNE